MKCEECGTPDMRVIESYKADDCVYRVRKCTNPSCDWRCVTHEKFVDEYSIPKAVRDANRKKT